MPQAQPPREATMRQTNTTQHLSQVVRQCAPDRKRAALYEAFSRFSQAFDDVSDEELEREIAKAQAEVREDRRVELERMIAESGAQTLQPSAAEAPVHA